MHYYLPQPTATIFTGYTIQLSLYPLRVIKHVTCIWPRRKVALKFSVLPKTAKNRPKTEKKSNLKVDALPHTLTDSTHIYRVYYPTIPLSNAGNKKILACN